MALFWNEAFQLNMYKNLAQTAYKQDARAGGVQNHENKAQTREEIKVEIPLRKPDGVG